VVSVRSAEIPGVGPLLASALVADVPNPQAFASGRNLAAWIVELLARRATKVARMVWAIMVKGERYREPVVGQAV
jgi:transposase